MRETLVSCARWAALVSIFLLAASSARAEICVDRDDSDCESTVQAGVDAAAPGETVLVAPGFYRETVSIPAGKDDLTLKGGGEEDETQIEPDGDSGIFVESDGVSIRKLTILRAPRAAIVLKNVADVKIKHVTLDGNTVGVAGKASDLEVDDVTARSGEAGISLLCDGCEVRESRFLGLSTGLFLNGDDCSVEDNRFERAANVGLAINGDAANVRDNIFAFMWNTALAVEGDDAQVKDNTVTGAQLGLVVAGDDPSVKRNELSDVRSVGVEVTCRFCEDAAVSENSIARGAESVGLRISATGPGLVAKDNTIEDVLGGGIELNGSGVLLSGASVKRCGALPAIGIDILGEGITVEESEVKECTGAGMRISTGDGNLIQDSESRKNGRSGFELAGGQGNRLLRNLAKKNRESGFQVGGGSENAILEDNEAKENRDSLCDAGSDTSQSGNDFPTSGTGCLR